MAINLLCLLTLDFGSVLGADERIILPDSLLFKVLHAHTRAEVITDFYVSRQFDSFAELKGYNGEVLAIINKHGRF